MKINDLERENVKLRQQLAEAQKDAERYRWLRNKSSSHYIPAKFATLQDGIGIKVILGFPGVDHKARQFLYLEHLDDAIDAAIAAAQDHQSKGECAMMSYAHRKADYVREAKQDRQHTCHWPGCEQQVPPAMWGCKPHWFRLPKELRDALWKEYQPGQEIDGKPSGRYLAVAHLVQEWIAGRIEIRPDGSVHPTATPQPPTAPPPSRSE